MEWGQIWPPFSGLSTFQKVFTSLWVLHTVDLEAVYDISRIDFPVNGDTGAGRWAWLLRLQCRLLRHWGTDRETQMIHVFMPHICTWHKISWSGQVYLQKYAHIRPTWNSLALWKVRAGSVALGIVLKHQQSLGTQLQWHGWVQSCLESDNHRIQPLATTSLKTLCSIYWAWNGNLPLQLNIEHIDMLHRL